MKIPLSLLIVDDNLADIHILERYLSALENWEIQLSTCETGDDARNHINKSDRDIIIVDYNLGSETGIEIIRSLKEIDCKASFILLTGMGDQHTILEAFHEGIDDYILKTDLSPASIEHSIHKIFQQRKTENDLRISQEGLKEAQTIARLGNWNWDIVNNSLHWSDEIYRIFGLEPQEFAANYEAFMESVHPDDRDLVNQAVKEALEENKSYSIYHRIIRKDQVERIVHEKGKVYFDNSGKPVRMVGTVQDVTERMRTEESLRLSAKVFQSTSEGIMITDTKGVIVQINKAFTKITGYTEQEALGQTPSILKSGRHEQSFYEHMWYSLTKIGFWQGEIWDRRKNGEIFPKWMSINAVKNDHGIISHYVAIFNDITTRKRTEEVFQRLAHYDTLTGLPNRVLFQDRLQQAIIQAKRKKYFVALLFLDLDRFKNINDSLGHLAGDFLLTEVSKRLTNCIRSMDTVARLGGDEFTIILTEITNSQGVTSVANKIIESFKEPFLLNNQEMIITTSIGITLYPNDGQDMEVLLKNADLAMYHAKSIGKNNYQFFSADMNIELIEQIDLELNLRRALEKKEFILHYQPQISLKTGKIIGVEALLRWQPSKFGLVPPGKFIPLAEETGLIIPIGEWVLKESFEQQVRWSKMGFQDIRVAVNLSAKQFMQRNLLESISNTINETNVNPSYIEIEITESAIMNDIDQGIKLLYQFKDMGFKLALDDFGTGYSSLSYLKKFPLDTLKIDQSFIRDMENDQQNSAIVAAIISLGQNLNLKILAEGVEKEDQIHFLRKHHCEEVQGYYFSKPIDQESLTSLLQKEIIFLK